jgi:hypothetical protein
MISEGIICLIRQLAFFFNLLPLKKPETNVDNNIMGWLNGILIKQAVGSLAICLAVLHFRNGWGKVPWSAMRTVGWPTV